MNINRKQPVRTCVLVGEGWVAGQCLTMLLNSQLCVRSVVTADGHLARQAEAAGVECMSPAGKWARAITWEEIDCLFSIGTAVAIPEELISRVRQYAIRYHEAPLPRYAGYNGPAWAIMHRETEYGIAWEVMSSRVGTGDIVGQREVAIARDDTSFSLIAKCNRAAAAAFGDVIADLAAGNVRLLSQNPEQRTYYSQIRRPECACTISFRRRAHQIDALLRGLDFGPLRNPLGMAKIYLHGQFFLVSEGHAICDDSEAAEPGTVLALNAGALVIAVNGGRVVIRRLANMAGEQIAIPGLSACLGLYAGSRLRDVSPSVIADVTRYDATAALDEPWWVERLASLRPALAGFCPSGEIVVKPLRILCERTTAESLAAAFLACVSTFTGENSFDVGLEDQSTSAPCEAFSRTVPFGVRAPGDLSFARQIQTLAADLKQLRSRAVFAQDIWFRYPELGHPATLPCCIRITDSSASADPSGLALTFAIAADGSRATMMCDSGLSPQLEQVPDFVHALHAAPELPVAAIATSLDLRPWVQTTAAALTATS